jgi:hypothetical protein
LNRGTRYKSSRPTKNERLKGNNEKQVDKYRRKWKERWKQTYDNETEVKGVIFVSVFRQKETGSDEISWFMLTAHLIYQCHDAHLLSAAF